MSDKETQAKGKFEPPPWEREAFEALAARRAEEQATAAMLAAGSAAETAKGPEATATPTAMELIPMPADPATASRAGTEPAPARQAAAQISADDPALEAMLLQLQAEERTDDATTKLVGWIASAITFVLGAGMLIFGLVAARDSGGKLVNVIGSGVLAVFGLCFMGMALWVWISTSRSRGRR